MKKFLTICFTAVLGLSLLAGCGSKDSDPQTGQEDPKELTKIVVGASPTPHAEILNFAKDAMKEKGFDLVVQEFTDYVLPNTAVADKSIDANFFQHYPYLENFNAEKKTDLVSAGAIHYEPFGIYPGKTKSFADLKEGAVITIPSDSSNGARALLLMEKAGLITLKEGVGANASVLDIVDNPQKLVIKEIEAAQLPRSLEDADMAVINGNYALQAGLSANENSLITEDASEEALTYANIIAVRNGDENSDAIKALVEVLKSDAVKQFINETYQGNVVPVE